MTGKKMNNASRTKEIYRLWYEYLKRSSDYKELCQYMNDNRKAPDTPFPDKFNKSKNGSTPPICLTYLRFFDVHNCTFETWWNEYGREQTLENDCDWPGIPPKFANDNDLLEKDFYSCIESFKRWENREPTLEEFIKYFIQLRSSDELRGVLHLRVDIFAETENLVNAYKSVIIKNKKTQTYKSRERWFNKSRKPTKPLYLDELKKYLEIYDLKKKMTLAKVIETAGTPAQKKNPNDANIQRMFRSYLKKARAIIKNAENGYFPGDYYSP